LSEILDEDKFYIDDLNILKQYLRDNRADLSGRLANRIPNISMRKCSGAFNYLELLNMG